jgi:hypothetical protein
MTTLSELAERCEKATGPDEALDFAIWDAVGRPAEYLVRDLKLDPPDYTCSLDAAWMLVPEGWGVSLSTPGLFHGTPQARLKHPERNPFGEGEAMRGSAATPALAICAGALRARTASAGEAGTAKTEGLGPKDEHAAPEGGDAQ